MSVDIPQSDLQRLCFLIPLIHGRKPFQRIFSLQDLMVHILQIGHLAAVGINHTQTVVPVVPGSVSRIFQKLGIQRKPSVINSFRVSGKSSVNGPP